MIISNQTYDYKITPTEEDFKNMNPEERKIWRLFNSKGIDEVKKFYAIHNCGSNPIHYILICMVEKHFITSKEFNYITHN